MKDNPYTTVILKSGKDQSVKRFHPWIFSGAIKKIKGNVSEGDIVSVYSNKDEFLGLGHYQIGSIAVRIFTFEQMEIDDNFWKNKLENAIELRNRIGLFNNKDTNVLRLVNAEGDEIPGLIIDFYNGVAVIQIHSIGIYHLREAITSILKDILGEKLQAVYDKSAKTLPFKAKIKPVDGYLYGNNQFVEILENGLKFKVDFEKGQKTGFFIDQRENRLILQKYARNKEVLNVFCYTGGFSVYALNGDAKLVHSVDSSTKAIDLCKENVNLNLNSSGDNRHKAIACDAFEYLKNIKDKYDLIILDPPAFSKHRDALPRALQGYKRLNAKAFTQIRKGGILFTFSCSQVVSKDKFREAVFSGAAISGRKVKILHQLVQPSDHPVNIYHPEGEYLKGLVLFVE